MLLYEAIGAHDMFKFKEKDIFYDLDLPPILLWEDFSPPTIISRNWIAPLTYKVILNFQLLDVAN